MFRGIAVCISLNLERMDGDLHFGLFRNIGQRKENESYAARMHAEQTSPQVKVHRFNTKARTKQFLKLRKTTNLLLLVDLLYYY